MADKGRKKKEGAVTEAKIDAVKNAVDTLNRSQIDEVVKNPPKKNAKKTDKG